MQNGAVFRRTVPNMKLCSHSINRAHARYCEVVSKELGPSSQLSARVQGLDLLLWYGHRGRILVLPARTRVGRVLEKKKCVDIGAQLRIVPGIRDRAPSVNIV